MTASQFRKKPVVIEAIRLTDDNGYQVAEWCGGSQRNDQRGGHVAIHTLEGTMLAYSGDYVIKGVQGEFYPCKPDIFDATYEPVDSSRET